MPEHDRTLLKEMQRRQPRGGRPEPRPSYGIAKRSRRSGAAPSASAATSPPSPTCSAPSASRRSRVISRPRDFRFTSAVHHLDRVGWQAVPIILLITFLIGGIIAQQGIFHFRKFGAEIYVVDLVGILVLREIGVLIVAIMVAGRSGSSYTAELGSMKMREEIDALRTMGLDPVEVLILPRVLALDHRAADADVPRLDGGALWRRPGRLALWRHEPDIFIARLRGGDLAHPFRGRHDQGAVHGAGHRRRRLRARACGSRAAPSRSACRPPPRS